MEHTKTYQEFKKNGNTKFVRYSEGAEIYHMSVSKFMQMAKELLSLLMAVFFFGKYSRSH